MKKAKLISLILALVMVSVVFVGCSGSNTKVTPQDGVKAQQEQENKAEAPQENRLTGTINVIGSTSVQPLAQSLADAFASVETGVKVDIQGVGSTAGVKAADDGTADIGTSSRELKPEEKEWNLTEHVIAKDGIAVIVHPNNTASNLTKEQVSQIFSGEITNWSQVGGLDKEIVVVSREEGSGTRGAFEEILKIEGILSEKALIAEGNGAVKQNIATKEDAIGYVSLGYLDDSIQAVSVDGVEATDENILASKYPIARPFLMLTKGELKPEVKAFLDFIMSSEGQKIVSEDYIPVK